MVEKTDQDDFEDIVQGVDDLQIAGEADDEMFEIVDQGKQNEEDDEFDHVIGCLQEILMDESFEKMQRSFSNDNCMQFEATEENKLVYMTIFKQYVDTTEQYITEKLTEAIPGFSMERFMGQLKTRKDEIDEPMMDLLLSLSEFESFKEMMLFARAHYVATTPKPRSSKAAALGLKDSIATSQAEMTPLTEGSKLQMGQLRHFENCIDQLQVSGQLLTVHKDEMNDGEEMADLNLSIKKI